MLGAFGLERAVHFVDASGRLRRCLGRSHRAGGEATHHRQHLHRGVRARGGEARAWDAYLLGQGTIYPDTIETGGTKRADVIKTHHNRVPIVERMIAEGKVVEPLADLYKTEVRELGERLGLPPELIWRHPFPGPGLGVRLLCSAGESASDEVAVLQEAVAEAAQPFGLRALALPIRSVGVKADLRSYEHPVLLSGERDWADLEAAAGTLLKAVPGINRCVWNLGDGEPVRARSLAATTTRKRLDLLREADYLVMQGLRRHGLYDDIWQCPTVLVPMELDGAGRELVILRPVYSARAMTARPAPLPVALIAELRDSILALPGVSGLCLDVTSKPPGTIEWE